MIMAQTVVSMRGDPEDRFDPKDVHVKSGDQIVWKNEEAEGGDQHTATSDDGTTFDTDFVNPQTSSAPVTIIGKPGTLIAYHCEVHAHMTGTVTIDP
jgi:plastocyanin